MAGGLTSTSSCIFFFYILPLFLGVGEKCDFQTKNDINLQRSFFFQKQPHSAVDLAHTILIARRNSVNSPIKAPRQRRGAPLFEKQRSRLYIGMSYTVGKLLN